MSKSLPLEAVKTMLKPVMHLIGKKAEKDKSYVHLFSLNPTEVI